MNTSSNQPDRIPMPVAGTTAGSLAIADLVVSSDDLTRVVRAALGKETLSVREWAVQPLRYTVRNTVSAGLYRLQGTAAADSVDSVRGLSLAWSLILKVVQPQEGQLSEDPSHWNYWRREYLAYQSGLLEKLTLEGTTPAGLVAPRCWGVEEQPDGRVWLWLEDVADAQSGRWTPARYGTAARHFGVFQGGFATGDPLPSNSWLSRCWMRARVASFADAMQRLHDPALWDDPLVRRTCPRSLEGRLSALWAEREMFLDALDHLPQTLCHLDVWRPNLVSRDGPDGEQTVALDWSYVGAGAIGQDIGNLVPDSLGHFDVAIAQAEVMDRAVFSGYLTGLRDAGWKGDARLARLGYAASAALGWGLGTPWWLVWPQDGERQAQIERQWGRPLEELLAQRAVLTKFVLDLADEARELLAQGTLETV